MTMHVALRPVSGLLLLGALLLRLSTTTAAQSDSVMPVAPTLAERLDRLAAELDRDRIDLHVPGAALAIVRGDEVIFGRKLGVADVESLVMTDQLGVSFDRDKTGRVAGLKIHQDGVEFEVPREGVYRDAAGALEFTVLIQNQRLAVRLPNNTSFDLRPPDPTGRRATRANVGLGVTFEESPTGVVSAMNFHRPGALPAMRLTRVPLTLPTVGEIMTLRRIPAASAIGTVRTTGSILVPQSAVKGRFSISTAGGDRLQDQRTVSSGDGGVIAVTTTYADYREMGGTRVPHRYVESTETTGRMIYQVDRVEVGVKLAPDTFTLKPFTASDRGR